MKNRVVHFEIHVGNPERAATFYKNVFDWKIDKWGEEQYWMVMTDEKGSAQAGINGGLLIRKGETPKEGQPVNAFVCTVQVDDMDAVMALVEKEGGKMAVPKFAYPGMAWQAYCEDSEGNIFGIHQSDISAK